MLNCLWGLGREPNKKYEIVSLSLARQFVHGKLEEWCNKIAHSLSEKVTSVH